MSPEPFFGSVLDPGGRTRAGNWQIRPPWFADIEIPEDTPEGDGDTEKKEEEEEEDPTPPADPPVNLGGDYYLDPITGLPVYFGDREPVPITARSFTQMFPDRADYLKRLVTNTYGIPVELYNGQIDRVARDYYQQYGHMPSAVELWNWHDDTTGMGFHYMLTAIATGESALPTIYRITADPGSTPTREQRQMLGLWINTTYGSRRVESVGQLADLFADIGPIMNDYTYSGRGYGGVVTGQPDARSSLPTATDEERLVQSRFSQKNIPRADYEQVLSLAQSRARGVLMPLQRAAPWQIGGNLFREGPYLEDGVQGLRNSQTGPVGGVKNITLSGLQNFLTQIRETFQSPPGSGRNIAFDKQRVIERMRAMWRGYLKAEPVDSNLSTRADEYIRAATAFFWQGGSLDLDSWTIDKLLRPQERWKLMYTDKPEGMDELEFLGDFDQQAAQLRAPARMVNDEIFNSASSGAGALGFGERLKTERGTMVANAGEFSNRLARRLAATVGGKG